MKMCERHHIMETAMFPTTMMQGASTTPDLNWNRRFLPARLKIVEHSPAEHNPRACSAIHSQKKQHHRGSKLLNILQGYFTCLLIPMNWSRGGWEMLFTKSMPQQLEHDNHAWLNHLFLSLLVSRLSLFRRGDVLILLTQLRRRLNVHHCQLIYIYMRIGYELLPTNCHCIQLRYTSHYG